MTEILIKGGHLDTETHTGSTPHENKGRDQNVASVCQGGQRLSANHSSQERGIKEILFYNWQKEPTLLIPWSVLRPPGLWDNKFLLFKTLSLWYFVRGVLENKHNLFIGLNDSLSFQDTVAWAWVPCTLSRWPLLHCVVGPLYSLQPRGLLVKKENDLYFLSPKFNCYPRCY